MLRIRSRFVGRSQLKRFSSTIAGTQTVNEHHSDETIISEGFKSVKILRLNRPDKQNAFNRSMLESLARELNSFEQDDSASVAVIHGMGGNFSSGYDLDELQTVAKNAPQELEKSLIFPYQRKTTKPILCGVSGVCKSIGFEIALMCDIRILENSSKLAFTDLELGIPHLANGPKLLANFIDRAAVIRLLTFSSEINSGEALEMGITKCDVVEDGTVLGSVLKQAVHLSSLPQLALRHDLNTLNGVANDDSDRWQSILEDIKTNVQFDKQTLKERRLAKLNNMPAWEMDEYEREKRYEAENTIENRRNRKYNREN